ncbi:hypothetical protein HDU93_003999 [Gonapodya sp. JEL0774]|nr:hypothetical protein HDU93_003999 [Gonapodya sp. JEL0774]
MEDASDSNDDPPLSVRSWVGLVTFFVSVAFCIHPVHIRIPNGWFIPLDVGTAPIIGVALLAAIGAIGATEFRNGFLGTGDIQPYAIVVLIFSLAIISLSIDLTGAFGHVALEVAQRAGHSGQKLWRYLYFLSALIAMFFSNDVVVLIMTPVILYFLEVAKIPPTPFLLPSFQVANMASIFFVLGNPTNILVAQGTGLSFLAYSAWMALPTVATVIAGYFLLFILFRNQVPTEVDLSRLQQLRTHRRYRIHDRFGAYFGAACMCVCLVTLMVVTVFSNGISVAMLSAPFAAAVLLRDMVADLVRRRSELAMPVVSESALDPNSSAMIELHNEAAIPVAAGIQLSPLQNGEYPAFESSNGSDDQLVMDDAEIPAVIQKTNRIHHNNSPTRDQTFAIDLSRAEIKAEKLSSIHEDEPSATELASPQHRNSSTPSQSVTKPSIFPFPTLKLIFYRLPWKIAPFAIAMFILVESLETLGWLARFAWCAQFLVPSYAVAVISVGVVSTLVCNVTCNLPMTILFVRILNHPNAFPSTSDPAQQAAQDVIRTGALWGVVIGANLGGNLTSLGALAGLMWMEILKRFGERVDFLRFVWYGVLVTTGLLCVALGIVVAEMAVMYPSVYDSALKSHM